jgi:hypothetical protein
LSAEWWAATTQNEILLVLRRFEGGSKPFPLRHLALHNTSGEAAKIEIPVREQGSPDLPFFSPIQDLSFLI